MLALGYDTIGCEVFEGTCTKQRVKFTPAGFPEIATKVGDLDLVCKVQAETATELFFVDCLIPSVCS